VNAGKINFGLILIITGVAAFAVNIDRMHWSVYLDLLDLWPVLLIVIGLQMVLKRLPVPQLAYLSSVLLLTVGAWVLYTNQHVYSIENGTREISIPMEEIGKDTERLLVDFVLDNCDLTVSSEKDFLALCHNPEPIRRPDAEISKSGRDLKIEIKEDKILGLGFLDRYDNMSADWGIEINNSLPTEMNFDCRDCDLTLRLYDFDLKKLDLDAQYSDIYLKLGDNQPRVDVKMDIGRSMVHLRIPNNTGIRITNSYNFKEYYVGDIDFLKEGDDFITPDFDSAAVQYRLDIDGNPRLMRIACY